MDELLNVKKSLTEFLKCALEQETDARSQKDQDDYDIGFAMAMRLVIFNIDKHLERIKPNE